MTVPDRHHHPTFPRGAGTTHRMIQHASVAKARGLDVRIVVAFTGLIPDLSGTSLTHRDFVSLHSIRNGSLRGFQGPLFIDHAVWNSHSFKSLKPLVDSCLFLGERYVFSPYDMAEARYINSCLRLTEEIEAADRAKVESERALERLESSTRSVERAISELGATEAVRNVEVRVQIEVLRRNSPTSPHSQTP